MGKDVKPATRHTPVNHTRTRALSSRYGDNSRHLRTDHGSCLATRAIEGNEPPRNDLEIRLIDRRRSGWVNFLRRVILYS
jgi:hypothetical protein